MTQIQKKWQVLMIAAAFFVTPLSFAMGCNDAGEPVQFVELSANGKVLDSWDVLNTEYHRVKLPNGMELGIKIEPAPKEKYLEILKQSKRTAFSELVKITLQDMNQSAPKKDSFTWGGTNSRQGYGNVGKNDDRPGVQVDLWLLKPHCVTEKSLMRDSK